MTNDQLIEAAATVLSPRRGPDNRLFGDVGAAALSENGKVFKGVCIDTASWGLCAERSALAAMATAGEYRVEKIVAVWRDEHDGKLHVLPPCGICREFMRKIHDGNINSEVILGRDQTALLSELLPWHEWPQPLD